MAHGWLHDLPPDNKAKAFIRSDLYGSYCNNSLSFVAQLRLVVLGFTLFPLKLLLCLFCVMSFYTLVVLGNIALREPFKTKYVAFWGKVWTRMLLYCLGFWSIKWLYVNNDDTINKGASRGVNGRRFGGYVSNHCR